MWQQGDESQGELCPQESLVNPQMKSATWCDSVSAEGGGHVWVAHSSIPSAGHGICLTEVFNKILYIKLSLNGEKQGTHSLSHCP